MDFMVTWTTFIISLFFHSVTSIPDEYELNKRFTIVKYFVRF